MVLNSNIVRRQINIALFCLSFFITSLASADVLFEGYYKVISGGIHIGYVIQKYEYDQKKKEFTSAYYIKTNALGGNLTESLKAKANDKFEPISYQYTVDANGKLKSIDAKVKKNKLIANVSDGTNPPNTLSVDVPKGSFFATFLGYLMLKDGYKKGKKFSYKAIAEEDAALVEGEALIESSQKFQNIDSFKIFNTFKGTKFISYVSEKGEVMATKSPVQQIATELVKNPEEATKGHKVVVSNLKLLFGEVPKGQKNALWAK